MPPRAWFRRGPRPFDAGELALDGIVLVTDRGLRWCSGRRKGPLAFPRDAIRGAAREVVSGIVELTVLTRTEKDVRLSCIEPRERGAELASALNPRADALDALLAEEEDGSVRLQVSDELDLARGLLKDGERPTAYAGALRGVRGGALVVTSSAFCGWPRKVSRWSSSAKISRLPGFGGG